MSVTGHWGSVVGRRAMGCPPPQLPLVHAVAGVVDAGDGQLDRKVRQVLLVQHFYQKENDCIYNIV